MNTLIVYYSLEGNTEYVANKIKDETDADLLKLIPVKPYHDKGFKKFFWGGKSAVMGDTPELEPYNVDINSYDRIIFGFPVWASTFAPPLRTFINEKKASLSGKTFCAFACQSGNGAEKAFSKLAKLLGISEFSTTAVFIDPKKKPNKDTEKRILEFAKNNQCFR